MSAARALGWWRHVVVAAAAAGLLAAPGLAPPAGWLPCLIAGAAAIGLIGRGLLRRSGPQAASSAAIWAWLACTAALSALAGLGAGGARLDAIDSGALRGPVGATVEVDGFVAGTVKRSYGEVRVPLDTSAGRLVAVAPEPVGDLPVGSGLHAEGRLLRAEDPFRAAELKRLGAALELRAEALEPTGAVRGGIGGALDRVRSRAEDALGTGMGPEQAALARGFVLGQDDRIDPRTRADFKRSGLSHLLAVSGQNVMLLAILASVILAAFGAGLRMRLVLTLLLIAAYVPVAGAGPSIERAGVMGAAGILATLAGRPSDRAYPALLAACVTLLINPRFGSDVGWQLSFVALVGIMLWAAPIRDLLAGSLTRRLPRRLATPLAEGAALTIAATVATAPLIAHDFDQLSLAALPANLVVLVVIAPVMWLGMLIGLVAQLPAVHVGPFDPVVVLDAVEGFLVDVVARIANALGTPGWAQVELPLPGTATVLAVYLFLAALLTLAITIARRRRDLAPARTISLALAAVVLLALVPFALRPDASGGAPPRGMLRITELDVGQGDSILLEPPRGDPILVDGGPPGDAAATALRERGIDRLAAVFVTHDELDHAGGIPAVLQSIHADELIHARPAPEAQALARATGTRVVPAVEGRELDFGRLELDVIWPPRASLVGPAENKNFDAIVLVARFAGYDALLSSDAEQEVTHLDPGPLDVLKVAHHGSDDAGLDALLGRSLPQVALISVGAGNSYGHPTEETMATLAEHGTCVLRTDLDGAASVELGPAGLEASTTTGPPPVDRPGCAPGPG